MSTPADASCAQNSQICMGFALIGDKLKLAQNGGFARYRPTAVTTLRDQPPNAWRTSASRVLGPDGGEASNQRVVEHEEPA